MQLKEVKISNILSFGHDPDFENSDGVVFSTGEKGIVNIFIGPNGSGKSNFLEVINQVFKAAFIKDYTYNRSLVLSGGDLSNTITENRIKVMNLSKHFHYLDQKSRVYMKVVFNRNDYDNIGFIAKYRKEINDIIAKYSKLKVFFPPIDIQDLVFHNMLDVYFTFDLDHNKATLKQTNRSSRAQFMLLYIQHIQLIQLCMNIHNDFERPEGERKWYPLKNTFAILGSDRQFLSQVDHQGTYTITPSEKSVLLAAQSTKSSAFVGYQLCMSKIVHTIKTYKETCDLELQECIDQALAASPFFQGLQDMVHKYINMQIVVWCVNDVFTFGLQDSRGEVYGFTMLSAGEQSFLMILLSLYGYDLQNGLMIIDEPELHLHPQMQKTFMDMVSDVSESLGMQFIIATHSPLMITEKNIGNVYKCSKKRSETSVTHARFADTIKANEANMIHMLKFENVAKVFFVDTIIMVEGETDAYFFQHYLDYLRQHDMRSFIKDYEIVNINGKGSYRRWQKFLHKFGIDAYYIGDWDNILDTTDMDETRWFKDVKRHSRRHKIANSGRYGSLIKSLKTAHPDKHQELLQKIDALYEKDILILKQGDLETYLGLGSKGLDVVVEFCHTHFQEWIHDENSKKYRLELEQIFRRIFHNYV